MPAVTSGGRTRICRAWGASHGAGGWFHRARGRSHSGIGRLTTLDAGELLLVELVRHRIAGGTTRMGHIMVDHAVANPVGHPMALLRAWLRGRGRC